MIMNDVLENKSLLWLTSIAGDEPSGHIYTHFTYNEMKIHHLFDKFFPKDDFGKELHVILLAFYIKGEHDWFAMPEKIKLGKYSRKQQEIRIHIPMNQDMIHMMANKNNSGIFAYYTDLFSTIIQLLEKRKSIQQTDFDLEKFKSQCYLFLMEFKANLNI